MLPLWSIGVLSETLQCSMILQVRIDHTEVSTFSDKVMALTYMHKWNKETWTVCCLLFYWKTKWNIIANDDITLQWAVVAFHSIYSLLNYWNYYKLVRLCKIQHKQNSSHYTKFSFFHCLQHLISSNFHLRNHKNSLTCK